MQTIDFTEFVKKKGDFELTTRVGVDMNISYDSACLMIMTDSKKWAKLCYENWQGKTLSESTTFR